MLGPALAYPKSGDEWVKTVLVGGLLSAVGSFLLLPLVPLQGYFVRVLRSGAGNEREPPVFEEWGDLFVDGIKLLAIQFVYLSLPVVVAFVGLVLGGFGAFSEFGGTTAGAIIELVGQATILVGALSLPVAVYLLPAAMAHLAVEDEFVAAFDFTALVDVALTGDYFRAVAVALVAGAVLGAVAAALSLVLVGVFLGFYVQVSLYYLLGRGYAAALASGRRPAPAPAPGE